MLLPIHLNVLFIAEQARNGLKGEFHQQNCNIITRLSVKKIIQMDLMWNAQFYESEMFAVLAIEIGQNNVFNASKCYITESY